MVLLMVRIEARISQVTIHCKKKQVSALEGVLEQKEAKVPMTDFYNNNKERERDLRDHDALSRHDDWLLQQQQ
jgi:hypothetical protein